MWYLIHAEHRVSATPDDYQRLEAGLAMMGATRVFWCLWAVQSSMSSNRLRDYILTLLHVDDRLLITEIPDNAAAHNLMVPQRTKRWIHNARELQNVNC